MMRELLLVIIGAVLATIVSSNLATAPIEILASQAASALPATIVPSPESASTASDKQYRVMKVVDGDTVVIDMEGKSVTVRLIGLDTPETVDPRKPAQCFGAEASKRAKELLEGKRVAIEKDATQGELDKYGRLLLYVYLRDGTLFNEFMIAEGYGHEYTYNLPYKYQAQFKAAERHAREEKKGLWSDNRCAEESVRAPRTIAVPIPSVIAPTGNYECARNIYNCSSFKTRADAQSAFADCGGALNDVHKLDNDKDGVVCESLP